MQNPLKMLGDINKLRKQAAQIQKALEEVEIEGKSGNVLVKMTGNQKVTYVEVDGVSNDHLKNAFNDAIKRSQQVAASKLADVSKDMQE